MKKELTVLYGQAPDLSTSFQTRELARHLEPWFSIRPLELPRRVPGVLSNLTRLLHNYISPALRRPKTDYVLYGNDGIADLHHWRAQRLLYWYDAPADWAVTPPTNFKDRLRYQNVIHADHVFAVSAAQVRVAKALRPGRENSAHYLPVGVDCKFFDPAITVPPDWISRLGIRQDDIVIGYLGYLGKWQNRFAGEALLEAAALLKTKNFHLLIIGSGPALPNWRAKAAQLQLLDRCHFAGYIPTADLPSTLAAADICIDTLEPGFHSEARSETKLKQYMAMARAIVATDIGENRVDLDQGRAGLLAAPNPTSLAHAIDQLAADPALRAQLGAAARQRALSHYAWPVLAQKLATALALK
jgi:glycosyltransferase involved in cell wall biosynthesis